jgi:Xaa-Pro aminopeptidase
MMNTIRIHTGFLAVVAIMSLGVRIEDMVVVTDTGARWLSDGLPRKAEDIELWMATRKKN